MLFRSRADYDINVNIARLDAAAAVKSAAMIIEAFNSLVATDRQAVTDVIKNYEQDILREPTWRKLPR